MYQKCSAGSLLLLYCDEQTKDLHVKLKSGEHLHSSEVKYVWHSL